MKKSLDHKYEKPNIFITSLDLEGFLCASIVKAKLYVEVDEYVNMGEDTLVMDGYDY